MNCHQFTHAITRRDMLRTCANGFGQLALAAIAGRHAIGAPVGLLKPSPPMMPHIPARAKRVIFLFMWGGPSHVDLFDPKPRLNKSAGEQLSGQDVGSKRDKVGEI